MHETLNPGSISALQPDDMPDASDGPSRSRLHDEYYDHDEPAQLNKSALVKRCSGFRFGHVPRIPGQISMNKSQVDCIVIIGQIIAIVFKYV